MEMTERKSVALDCAEWEPLLFLGAQEVFEMMIGTKLVRCLEPEPMIVAEFTAMVGLAGQLCGLLTIRCSEQAASTIASRMLGMNPEDVDQEKWDAMGEVCNMVAGNFKSKLNGLGDNCMLSVPTVITGADYKLRSLADGEVMELCTQFDNELLWITLELHS